MTKTRFAPSPTGYLHVGGARTALFSWLFARNTGGKFVLRIEDTDRERSTEESVQAILDGMQWLKLDYDEEPIFQTDRFDRYEQIIQQLLGQEHAYYCECSKDRLQTLREQQMQNKQKPRYDGCCRELNLKPETGKDLVVRFKTPLSGEVTFDDQIKGSITVKNSELDDLIIKRTDGSPTYNLTVVVDDIDMEITHVIRGDDHVNNTPRQINIFQALSASTPQFAHVPMILGDDGKRLSKRHGAVGVMQYFEDGYLPEALLNYLVRLGWSHGDQEIFSIEQMVELFSLSDINKSPSIFNTEKLNWINQHYLKNLPLDRIVRQVKNRLKKLEINFDEEANFNDIVALYRERVVTINELTDNILYLFKDFDEYDIKAAKKTLKNSAKESLELLHSSFIALPEWNAKEIQQAVHQVVEKLGVNMGKVGQPLRVAVSGVSFSPPIDVTVEMLGRQRTLDRIQRAITFVDRK